MKNTHSKPKLVPAAPLLSNSPDPSLFYLQPQLLRLHYVEIPKLQTLNPPTLWAKTRLRRRQLSHPLRRTPPAAIIIVTVASTTIAVIAYSYYKNLRLRGPGMGPPVREWNFWGCS